MNRYNFGICEADGQLYVAGGSTSQGMTSACERFNLLTQQ